MGPFDHRIGLRIFTRNEDWLDSVLNQSELEFLPDEVATLVMDYLGGPWITRKPCIAELLPDMVACFFLDFLDFEKSG